MWFATQSRMPNKRPINPLDKATIVSIFPMELDESKPTIQPSRYKVPAGTLDKPGILVITPASWWKDVGEDQPLLEIPESSISVAESIIRDYSNGALGCNMADRMPGLFYVEGSYIAEEIKAKFPERIELAHRKQRAWYEQLVMLADVAWARSMNNPLAINGIMKLAAQELGLKNKTWLSDFNSMQMVSCVGCGNLRNPAFPICPHCKVVVDPVKFKELNLQIAQ